MNKPFLVSVAIISVAAFGVMQLNNYLDANAANADVRSIKHTLEQNPSSDITKHFTQQVLPTLEPHLLNANMRYQALNCSLQTHCQLQIISSQIKHDEAQLETIVEKVKAHQNQLGVSDVALMASTQLDSGEWRYNIALTL